jgi:hypothetical protein
VVNKDYDDDWYQIKLNQDHENLYENQNPEMRNILVQIWKRNDVLEN